MRKKLDLAEFKVWAREHRELALAVCKATAFAEIEKQRVAKYIQPVFEQFDFTNYHDGTKIISPDHLYLSRDEKLTTAYFEACDKAHREHGFTGPHMHSPDLIAENIQVRAEQVLIEEGQKFMGIEDHGFSLEQRQKFLDLLLGACLMGYKQTKGVRANG